GFTAFFGVFFGGVLIGWLMALLVASAIGRVRGDPLIEITLTTILAYLSFLVAEEVFHVSGVMAVVAAGTTLGGWGRVKISPSVRHYLEHFWEYLAFIANALIFLLVGLRVDLAALGGALDLLLWVVVAMLLSRAAVVYGLVPLLGRLPGAEPIESPYRHVMWWGGLRGAIALAIVLSLPQFELAETFVALVTGAVLFTLLAQGLTIERLVRRLGLDRPPLADRLARREGLLAAKQLALARIPELQRGGLFSARIADGLGRRYRAQVDALHAELAALREAELDAGAERQWLFLRCLAMEKTHYLDGFGRGHLSERAYRDLAHSIDSQIDALRHRAQLPDYTLHPPHPTLTESLLRGLRRLLQFTRLPDRWRAAQVAQEYEEAWGRYQGSLQVLHELERMAGSAALRASAVESVRGYYRGWVEAAGQRIDSTAELFPEYVATMQERLAGRLALFAERAAIEHEQRNGTLSAGVAGELLADLGETLYGLRGGDVGKLQIGPEELLRKVPFFEGMAAADFARVAACLHGTTVPAGEAIVEQDERGDSMYLIGRGVVRVARAEEGGERDLATLLAGDFFGEMALLNQAPRTATCRAVTPCALYELRREDFDAVCRQQPSIRSAVEQVERERSAQLSGG
ncbi:MAG TPA: cation:proton antiporter, partial [Gammaproteobacteria bacterium]